MILGRSFVDEVDVTLNQNLNTRMKYLMFSQFQCVSTAYLLFPYSTNNVNDDK